MSDKSNQMKRYTVNDVTRVILVACGAFNPPTNAHFRMFERGRDYLQSKGYRVLEGIISPVADDYGKPELVAARHRLAMLKLAMNNSNWIRIDDWECRQAKWSRTVSVLRHMHTEIQTKYDDTDSKSIRLMLLCGSDMIASFPKILPNGDRLWQDNDIETIVRDFGLIAIARSGINTTTIRYEMDILRRYECNIHVIEDETCPNDISSTRLRRAIRRKESIRYCTDDAVIDYIARHSLYTTTVTDGDGNDNDDLIASSTLSIDVDNSSTTTIHGNSLISPSVADNSSKLTTIKRLSPPPVNARPTVITTPIDDQQHRSLISKRNISILSNTSRKQGCISSDAPIWTKEVTSTIIPDHHHTQFHPISLVELYDNVQQPTTIMSSSYHADLRNVIIDDNCCMSTSNRGVDSTNNNRNGKTRSQSGEFRRTCQSKQHTPPPSRQQQSINFSSIQAKSVENIAALHMESMQTNDCRLKPPSDNNARCNMEFKLCPTPETTV